MRRNSHSIDSDASGGKVAAIGCLAFFLVLSMPSRKTKSLSEGLGTTKGICVFGLKLRKGSQGLRMRVLRYLQSLSADDAINAHKRFSPLDSLKHYRAPLS